MRVYIQTLHFLNNSSDFSLKYHSWGFELLKIFFLRHFKARLTVVLSPDISRLITLKLNEAQQI